MPTGGSRSCASALSGRRAWRGSGCARTKSATSRCLALCAATARPMRQLRRRRLLAAVVLRIHHCLARSLPSTFQGSLRLIASASWTAAIRSEKIPRPCRTRLCGAPGGLQGQGPSDGASSGATEARARGCWACRMRQHWIRTSTLQDSLGICAEKQPPCCCQPRPHSQCAISLLPCAGFALQPETAGAAGRRHFSTGHAADRRLVCPVEPHTQHPRPRRGRTERQQRSRTGVHTLTDCFPSCPTTIVTMG